MINFKDVDAKRRVEESKTLQPYTSDISFDNSKVFLCIVSLYNEDDVHFYINLQLESLQFMCK